MLLNLAYSGLSNATAAFLLLLFIAAARMLGSEEFGKLTFALMLGSIFETLMDFGLHQVTVRAVARDRSRAPLLLRHTLGLKLVWAAVTLTLLVVTTNVLRPESDVRFACYLIGAALIFRSYMLTIRGVLQGLEHFGWETLILVADRGLMLAFGLYALWIGSGVRGVAVAFVAARGVALVVSFGVAQMRLGGVGVGYDAATWKELQTTALPLGLFLVVLNLYQYLDTVMLGYLRTDTETGLYGAAFKVYEGLTYGAMAISAVLTPRLSALSVSDRGRHRTLAAFGTIGSAAFGAAVGIVGYLLARPALTLLFGPAFGEATATFRILCAGLPVVFAIWILHAIAISVDRERLLLVTGLIGLAVNVGLNAVLIPRQGPAGAALATVGGEALSMAILIVGLRSRPSATA